MKLPKDKLTPNELRLGALRRFAFGITTLNTLGHLWLGFEVAYFYPLVALATAYSLELTLESIDARLHNRKPAFAGGLRKLVDFLLPAHISGMAVSMLLYSGNRVAPIVFAAAVAVLSKFIFRAPTKNGPRHFYNPSNSGIGLTLLLFPDFVSVAPPYQFTENLVSTGDWVIIGIIIVAGSMLNGFFTLRLPLILGWVGGFAAQAVIRGLFFDFRLPAALLVMTGPTFILFSFYMISDPGTTPTDARRQVLFGASVALLYGVFNVLNLVFGFFISLAIVCTCRGIGLYIMDWRARSQRAVQAVAVAVEVSKKAA